MTPEQAEAHGTPVALLRSLSVRERTTILAQVVREGTMTRAGADQVLIAVVLQQNGLSVR